MEDYEIEEAYKEHLDNDPTIVSGTGQGVCGWGSTCL